MRATAKLGRFTLLLSVILAMGCNSDYTVQLPNKYFVARVYSGAFFIANPQNRGVTDLSRQGIAVAVVGDIVVGAIDPESQDNSGTRTATGNHFIINTATNEAWRSLSPKDYRRVLLSVGISSPPHLVRISRFVTLQALRPSV